jgi:uncharacterized Zn finger protein
MSDWEWEPYIPVAQKKRQAASRAAKLKKQGHPVEPVAITGRNIANSFWGIAWCENLERYSDYASRLPRGRSYVRNGAVIDLQIGKGQVTATVSGTDLYAVKITIEPVTSTRWKAVCKDCSGAIDSLVELLQGHLAKGVMERVCRQGDGLFPAPREIKLSCDCPDWADMCKHVAAVLYGVGARLDEKPELLFLLRGVDERELIAGAGETLAQPQAPLEVSQVLAAGDMAALFGLDMADGAETETPSAAASKPPRRQKTAQAQSAATRGAGGPKSPSRKKTSKTVTASAIDTGGASVSKPVPKNKTAKAGSASAPAKARQAKTAEQKLRRIPAEKAETKRLSNARPPNKTLAGKKGTGNRAPRSK